MSNRIFTHCIWDLRQMANQNKVTLPLPYWVRAPNVTRCYRIWREKWKAVSLLLICRMMKSVFIFFLRSRLFQLPILFSWEAQGRSDNPTKKKSSPQLSFWEQSDEKNFSKGKTGGFFPFILTSETNMYFVLSLNTEQVDRSKLPSASLILAPAKDSFPAKGRGMWN